MAVRSPVSRRELLRRLARRARRVAAIRPELCAAWSGSDCRLCAALCPRPGAVDWNGGGPRVEAALCDGCGICLASCESAGSPGAIRLVPGMA
ncbi:MAG: hypothetical protein ACRD3M_15920 [Thermoanaerobaculia bacterium]